MSPPASPLSPRSPTSATSLPSLYSGQSTPHSRFSTLLGTPVSETPVSPPWLFGSRKDLVVDTDATEFATRFDPGLLSNRLEAVNESAQEASGNQNEDNHQFDGDRATSNLVSSLFRGNEEASEDGEDEELSEEEMGGENQQQQSWSRPMGEISDSESESDGEQEGDIQHESEAEVGRVVARSHSSQSPIPFGNALGLIFEEPEEVEVGSVDDERVERVVRIEDEGEEGDGQEEEERMRGEQEAEWLRNFIWVGKKRVNNSLRKQRKDAHAIAIAEVDSLRGSAYLVSHDEDDLITDETERSSFGIEEYWPGNGYGDKDRRRQGEFNPFAALRRLVTRTSTSTSVSDNGDLSNRPEDDQPIAGIRETLRKVETTGEEMYQDTDHRAIHFAEMVKTARREYPANFTSTVPGSYADTGRSRRAKPDYEKHLDLSFDSPFFLGAGDIGLKRVPRPNRIMVHPRERQSSSLSPRLAFIDGLTWQAHVDKDASDSLSPIAGTGRIGPEGSILSTGQKARQVQYINVYEARRKHRQITAQAYQAFQGGVFDTERWKIISQHEGGVVSREPKESVSGGSPIRFPCQLLMRSSFEKRCAPWKTA